MSAFPGQKGGGEGEEVAEMVGDDRHDDRQEQSLSSTMDPPLAQDIGHEPGVARVERVLLAENAGLVEIRAGVPR